MKKVLSLLLAVTIITTISTVAFADENKANEEDTFDLSTITQPVQVIFEDQEILPDGTVVITTTKATRPILTKIGTEYATVIAERQFVSGGTIEATVTLTTDFWYNRYDKIVGWSDATVDVWSYDGNDITAAEPKGESYDPIIGLPWVKVSTKWTLDGVGEVTTGTVWNKINSDGKISRS